MSRYACALAVLTAISFPTDVAAQDKVWNRASRIMPVSVGSVRKVLANIVALRWDRTGSRNQGFG